MRLRIDGEAAHRVMRRRRHLHRQLGDVQHLILDELPIHPRQFLQDLVLRSMRDIEEHAAVGAAAALHDLGIDGERHPIARAQLHTLRVIALHEPLVITVVEAAALAADRLGDEGARHLFWHQHPGWMELHELHIHQAATGLERQVHALAIVLVAAR